MIQWIMLFRRICFRWIIIFNAKDKMKCFEYNWFGQLYMVCITTIISTPWLRIEIIWLWWVYSFRFYQIYRVLDQYFTYSTTEMVSSAFLQLAPSSFEYEAQPCTMHIDSICDVYVKFHIWPFSIILCGVSFFLCANR